MMLVDKPKGWTSQDVVAYLKKKHGWKKAGHTGTLDPMATGLLIILVNEETKRFDEFQKLQKEYEAEIELGYETETGDSEGKRINNVQCTMNNLGKEKVIKILEGMEGEQMQKPPIYSAVKVGGVAAYRLARRGQKPDLKPKKITVYETELTELKVESGKLKVRFVVSSGTYIRQLAVELGRKLGTGATLVGLRRVRIGEYQIVENAENVLTGNY
jgi:tRNA pseudouridine55 synthase